MSTDLLEWPHFILRDLSIFVALMVALVIALLFVVAKLPKKKSSHTQSHCAVPAHGVARGQWDLGDPRPVAVGPDLSST